MDTRVVDVRRFVDGERKIHVSLSVVVYEYTCVFICGSIRIYMCVHPWLYTNIHVSLSVVVYVYVVDVRRFVDGERKIHISLSVVVYEYTCVCICCIRIYITCRHVWIRAHIHITRIHLCVCEISLTWIGRFIIGRTREVGAWGRVPFSRI